MMFDEIECPGCNGWGSVHRVKTGRMVYCDVCGGCGKITKEKLVSLIKKGKVKVAKNALKKTKWLKKALEGKK